MTITDEQMARLSRLRYAEWDLSKEILNTGHLLSLEDWASLCARGDAASAELSACLAEMGIEQ